MRYRLRQGCEAEWVADEVAVTMPNGDIAVLNESAGVVLDAVREGGGLADAADALSEKYGIDAERAKRDAKNALEWLASRRIVAADSDSAHGVDEGSVAVEKPLEPSGLRRHSLGMQEGNTFSRRMFVAGMAALGASLLAPSLAFGEESARLADKTYNGDALGSWANDEAGTRIWTDSLGRYVEVPSDISKAAPYGPYAQAMLESIDPSLVANVSARGLHASTQVPQVRIASLSVDGESVASIDSLALSVESPDVIIDVGDAVDRLTQAIDDSGQSGDVPVVHISAAVEDLPQAYRTLGDFLGEESAYDLADYVAQMLVTFAQGREQITDDMRKKVYFGQGMDGLDTRAAGTLLDNVLTMIGADNAAHDLTEEQSFCLDAAMVEGWNPSFVALSIEDCVEGSESRELIRSIWKGTGLSYGRDVRLVPSDPFGWLDRSPLTMQTLGALWLANAVYPDVYDYDMVQVVQGYFNRFFHRDISASEAQALLDGAIDF